MYASTRRALTEREEGQAQWRRWKAEDYPEDARNAAAASALDSLARYVESWSEDDRRLRDWSEIMVEDCVSLCEEASWMLGRFGFHPSKVVNRDEFLRELLELNVKWEREHDIDGMPKQISLV